MCRDEVDSWPLVVGKDGDPMKLSAARCNSFENSYKLLDGSTPNVEETSRIADRFRRGDQRYYYVRCLRCGFPQVLRWNRTDNLTGTVSGIWWETDKGEANARHHARICPLHLREHRLRATTH
jgi:phage terminase large subunit GpA-like protein